MKPISVVLLAVLGLGAWLVATDYPTVISALTFFKQADPVAAETIDEGMGTSGRDDTEDAPSVGDTVSYIEAESNAELEGDSESEGNTEPEGNAPAVSEGIEDTMSKEGEGDQQVVDQQAVDDRQATEQQATEVADVAATDEDEGEGETLAEVDPVTEQRATDPIPSPHMSQSVMANNMLPMPPYGAWMAPSPSMQNYAGYSWMAPMFNPFYWMQLMMNPMVDAMTRPQSMDAMMRAADPRMMFGMSNIGYDNSQVPDQVPVASIPGFPTQTRQVWPKNTVSEGISREAKMNAFQTAMAMNPLSMRNMISMMTDKLPVAEGVTWDDAVEAMKLRANEVNFKFVGSSPLWKEIEAVTGQPSARVEIFRFCDGAVARKILDEVPEFIVFLPCKIALLEDANGKFWVMTMDWDVSWMDFAQNPNSHLAKDLRADAKQIREGIQYIMEGAATGEF